MKKIFLILPILLLFIGCIALPGEANTAFIIKNTSEKTINTTIGVIKCSQAFGCQEYKNAFTIKAKDSIIVRQTYFKKDGENPQNWFSKFDIFPVEGIEMNNPNLAENWKKTSNENVPTYTFTINK